MKRTEEEKRLIQMLKDLEADDRFLELTHHLCSDEQCLQIWPPADAPEYPKRPFEFFIVERGFGMKHRTSTIIGEVGAEFLAGAALRNTCCAKSFMYDVVMALQRDERLLLVDVGTYQKTVAVPNGLKPSFQERPWYVVTFWSLNIIAPG